MDGYGPLSNVCYLRKTQSWSGVFDEVRVYNRVVEEAEMMAIGNPATGFGVSAHTQKDASLILHYTFDEVPSTGDAPLD